MILVTLGTQDKEFTRLLKAIDKEIENGNIKEKVIVQAGCTKYESKNMEIFDLIDSKKFEELVKKCNILITHGGVGSILLGLKYNKKIIAASRLKKYKEHTNDHQKQIVKEFENKGYLLELRDFNKLGKLLEKARTFKANKFESNNEKFVSLIEDYIKEDNHVSWFNNYRELASYGYNGFLLSIINLLIFSLLLSKVNIYINVLFSFLLTFIISIIFSFMFNVSKNKKIKENMLICILSLILDLGLIFAFYNYFKVDLILSKLIVNFILIILTYFIIKFCFRKKRV